MLLALFNGVLVCMAMPIGAAAEQRPIRIVALGDSLTAGFMLPATESFPVQLEQALKAKAYAVEVINAGVSGDTTAAALDRFEWAVPDGIDAAIVELGANDALRGLDPGLARRNLDAIIRRLKAKGAEILIAGMIAPRNWGEAYAQQFDAIFPELARAHGALLYPFFLEGVALRQDLNLDDGLHPNGKGVAEIIERILPSVEELIRRVVAKRNR
jgi:acyl-CoA thioesterase-1